MKPIKDKNRNAKSSNFSRFKSVHMALVDKGFTDNKNGTWTWPASGNMVSIPNYLFEADLNDKDFMEVMGSLAAEAMIVPTTTDDGEKDDTDLQV